MGFSGVVFTILALHSPNIKKKLYYAFVALAAFYAMVISGTRGALAVPVAGFFLYALLSKKLKLVLVGTFILVSSFSFLKYTTIGNSKYELRRIRSALDSDNPSLVVRKDNQKRLKSYLASRPFGGGIGSAGNWGLRFSPGTFLAETPPDGWYVQIWAEQGKVGLSLHLIIVFSVLFYASFIILFKLKSKDARTKALALISGIFGVMVASYSSNAFGQMPNGIIIYMSMAFIVLLHKWDKQEQIEQI